MKLKNILLTIFTILLLSCSSDDNKAPLIEIAFKNENKTIFIGESHNLLNELVLTNTTIEDVVLVSDNIKVVSVSKGEIKGLEKGVSTITARVKNTEIISSLKVIVEDRKASFSKQEIAIYQGEVVNLAELIELENVAKEELIWGIESDEYLLLEGTEIKAKEIGETYITVSVKNTSITTKLKITIIDASINFKEESITVTKGFTVDLSKVLELKNIEVENLTWEVSDLKKAVVDYPNVIGKEIGEVVVTARYKDLPITGNIKVKIEAQGMYFTTKNIKLENHEQFDLFTILKLENVDRKDIRFEKTGVGRYNVEYGKLVPYFYQRHVEDFTIVAIVKGTRIKSTLNVTHEGIKVNRIVLSTKNIEVGVHESVIVNMDIYPKQVFIENIRITSTNPSVLRIERRFHKEEEFIVIHGLQKGSTTLNFSGANVEFASMQVTVASNEPLKFRFLEDERLGILQGTKYAMRYDLYPISDKQYLRWESDHKDVEVDNNGVVSVNKNARGIITLTVRDQRNQKVLGKFKFRVGPIEDLIVVVIEITIRPYDSYDSCEWYMFNPSNSSILVSNLEIVSDQEQLRKIIVYEEWYHQGAGLMHSTALPKAKGVNMILDFIHEGKKYKIKIPATYRDI